MLIDGDEISVMVLGVKGNQIRLGVNASKEISIHREEVKCRIDAEAALIAATGSLSESTN